MGALTLGCWAEDASRAASLRAWLKEHPPSEGLWTDSLARSGFRRPRDPRLLQHQARSLPGSSEDGVWITSDSDWIALFKEGAPRFFCLRCEGESGSWERLGDGWTGYDPALQRARARAAALASAVGPKKRLRTRDPLEIAF